MKHLQRKQNWRTALYSHTEAYENILNWKKKRKDKTKWPLHTQAVQIRHKFFCLVFLCRNLTQIKFLLQLSNCVKDNNFQKINIIFFILVSAYSFVLTVQCVLFKQHLCFSNLFFPKIYFCFYFNNKSCYRILMAHSKYLQLIII